MAAFTGKDATYAALVGSILVMLVPTEREPFGVTFAGVESTGARSRPTPAAYTPKVYGAAAVPPPAQPDWPDFVSETRAVTWFRGAALDARWKDRIYGIAANPRFLVSSLVFGLEYKLTVNLEEGPIGGAFSPYAPIERIYTATAASMEISIYLPTPAQGREIRITTYQNVRYYGA